MKIENVKFKITRAVKQIKRLFKKRRNLIWIKK